MITTAVLRELIAAGLEGQALIDACQRIEDANIPMRTANAERQARWRERQRESVTNNVTNVTSVTEKAPHYSPPFLSPTPPNLSPPISPPKPTRGARGSRLPKEWQPSQADLDFATDTGWEMEHVRIEAAKFRDYWIAQPGQKGVKLDWPATWRNWVRRSLPSKSHHPPNRKPSASEVIDGMLKELENERSETESTERVVELFPANRIGRG